MHLGVWELLLILALALLIFGGAKIATLGKGAGRAIREFKEESAAAKAVDGD
jgi:sec-independent protein translocase protein TatA